MVMMNIYFKSYFKDINDICSFFIEYLYLSCNVKCYSTL